MRGSELIIHCLDGVASLVQLARSGRGREVVRRAARVLPEGLAGSELGAHLAGLAAEADMAAPWSAVVLDGAGVLVREFSFPFSAASKVEQAVRFEMESGLPCPASELAGGVLVSREGKGCHVFSFSMRRETLSGLLEGLGEAGMDPSLVSVDLACLGSFAQRLPAGAGPACLLEVGFGRTLMAAVGADGALLGVARREFGVGPVVDACEGCTRQDVLDGGALPDVAGPLLSESVVELERAARQLALSCGLEPQALLVSGVGAGVPGLAQALADRSGLDVVPVWNVADPEAMGLAEPVGVVLAGALDGAGVMGARRGAVVNLRRGEFARAADPRGMFKRYAWVGAMALLLALAGGASLAARVVERSRTIHAGTQEIERIFHEAVPDAQGTFSRTQMFSILKTRIDRLQGRSDQGDQRPQARAIDILRAVNAAVPASLDATMDLLTVGDSGGRISGTANDFQAVNNLLENVAANGVLADVRIVLASAVKKTGRVRFELEYVRK